MELIGKVTSGSFAVDACLITPTQLMTASGRTRANKATNVSWSVASTPVIRRARDSGENRSRNAPLRKVPHVS
ncbi:hypothetical protein D9M69_666560 [compost metagenome]